MGSLSMTCYVVDGPAPARGHAGGPAATIPTEVPPEDTNL
jgi:hypothetical protein